MKYILKQAFLPTIYLIFFMIIGFSITAINLLWLELVLCAVLTIFYAILVSVAFYKDGEKAMRVRYENDLIRKVMVERGEDLPLRLHEEYKAWKGFVSGLVASLPTVILVIIHFLVQAISSSPNNLFGVVAGLYSVEIYGFFLALEKTSTLSYAFNLLMVPYLALICGVPYCLGGRKIDKQQAKIKETQIKIHGDKT